ncbi:hypothetical protein AB0M36_16975 [Actinoplanes sp. NPDC051346]|uniref:hypothetical protein n=1 Tax=Actinoplanes sp. NPDC051346 TaxID=3155048 RepID=UPI00344473FE
MDGEPASAATAPVSARRAVTASLSADWSPLADLVGPVATDLTGRLVAAGSIRARLALLDTFLAARLGDIRRDGRVSTAIGAIVDRGGAVEVASVARQAAASPRLPQAFVASTSVGGWSCRSCGL